MDLKKRLKKCKELSISCNGVKVKANNCVKYLGVSLDQDLSGSTMVKSVIQKVNSKIKFLYRKSVFLGFKERKMLSSALVLSNFDYASNSWYRGLAKKFKTRLQTSQNKVIRYICNFHSRKHIGVQEFKKLGWLNVSERVNYLSLGLMFNIHCKNAPSYLCNIHPVSHSYGTRRSQLSYQLPHVNTQGSYSFKYSTIKLWNNLPFNIKNSESKDVFKQKCKSHLINKMSEDEDYDFVY